MVGISYENWIDTILVIVLTFVLFLLTLLWRDVLFMSPCLILLVGFILLAWSFHHLDTWKLMGMGIIILILAILLRLSFVIRLILPHYCDSPTHYLYQL